MDPQVGSSFSDIAPDKRGSGKIFFLFLYKNMFRVLVRSASVVGTHKKCLASKCHAEARHF